MRSLFQESIAILMSILLLALGFLAIWITKNVLKIEADAVFVSLLLIPIIIYMVFSGRLKEIRAPGGLEASFADVAEKSVGAAAEIERLEVSVEQMQIVEKGDLSELKRTVLNVDESKPMIVTAILGKQAYYDRNALLQYVQALSQYRNFKFIVFLDSEGKFVAYMPSWMVVQTLKMESLGNELIQVVNQSRIQDLKRFPGVIMKPISTSRTNREALQQMTEQNLEALVVIDEENRLKGVVEREQILSKLMLAITK
jgi:CBS domain-containing protein